MMLDSAAGVELLLDVGLDRRITGSTEVEISAGGHRWSRRRVLLSRHSPGPVELDRAIASAVKSHHDGVYFVVSRAGSTLTEVARHDPRVAYVAIEQGIVSFLGTTYRVDDRGADGAVPLARVSWTRLAILRLFALRARDPLRQTAIASRIGVSHVTVAKQLPALVGLIERTPAGWRASDRAACWDQFLDGYPGPGGLASYFAATGDLAGQLARVERIVGAQREQQMIISGDFAADFYAPWRRPTRITAYVSALPQLDQHGFASVRAADATVEMRLPRDPTVQAMSTRALGGGGEERRYSDPLVAAWDLGHSQGGDVALAVAELRDRVLRETLWS